MTDTGKYLLYCNDELLGKVESEESAMRVALHEANHYGEPIVVKRDDKVAFVTLPNLEMLP